jgi:UDP-glucuronate decarboxylase
MMDYPALSGLGAARLAAAETRIVVVGAGGWLGLATLELLHGLLGERFSARVVCFGSSARTVRLRGGLSVDQRPLATLKELPAAPTLVLHLAFLTQEKAKVMSEAAYVAANEAMSGQVLEALDAIGAEGLFLPSSGAVYMVDQPSAPASMRLYGRLKLADETRFAAWSASRSRRAVIARVFNLSGPYINKQSSYALACFIADVLAERPIEIRANRPVLRSYVAISELMSVVFGALTDGGNGAITFDTAGDDVHEMEQVALAVSKALSGSGAILRPPVVEEQTDRYVGDGAVYRALRHRFVVKPVDFSRQVRETARFMAEAGVDA